MDPALGLSARWSDFGALRLLRTGEGVSVALRAEPISGVVWQEFTI